METVPQVKYGYELVDCGFASRWKKKIVIETNKYEIDLPDVYNYLDSSTLHSSM